ncbi:MAG: hypothetical protein ACXWIG_07020 [Caldimonas sp.]
MSLKDGYSEGPGAQPGAGEGVRGARRRLAREDKRSPAFLTNGGLHSVTLNARHPAEAGDKSMSESMETRRFQESRLEDEPILGTVLALPDGRIQPLTFWEKVLVALRLTDAKGLEARYFKPATS